VNKLSKPSFYNSTISLLDRVRKVFAPPVFDGDEDKTRFASILNIVTWCTFAITLSGLYLPMWVGPPIRTYVFVILWSILCITVILLNHKGFVRAGCILSVTGSWSINTFVVMTAGGINDPTFGLYIIIIAVAGLFFGWRMIVGIAVASVIAGSFMVIAERQEIMRFAQKSHSPVEMLLTHSIILIMAAVIISVAVQNLVKALARVRHELEERRQAEATLRESEDLYRALIETTGTGYVIIDAEGRVLNANQEYVNMTGHKGLNEIFGRNVVEWTAESERDKNTEAVRKCAIDGFTRNLEIEYADRHGKSTPIEINATVVEVGGVRRILSLCRDITERKRAEEEVRHMEERLRQSDKMEAIGRLAGGIAHDFNNQLAGIMGCADMLVMNIEDKKLREFADIIVQTARRAADLNKQLLAFARKGKYMSVPVDVHSIIGEVVSLLKHSIDKRIIISRKLNACSTVISGDPAQIQNSILNLAINASEAMPGGGDLVITTDEITVDNEFIRNNAVDIVTGKYLAITVSDTGDGMDGETVRHLFEPFFSTKKDGKNTGLGMSAVYGTVKNHNGGISVHSEKGHGTRIILYLPLTSDMKLTERIDSPVIPPAGRAHVLVIEDDDLVRKMVSAVLRNYGYTVTVCHDGEEALEEYKKSWRSFDLVILDMMMPKKSGRETFLEMRDVNPEIKAILSSGFSIDGEAQKILDEGVLSFIQKPYQIKDLLNAVGNALKKN
jgi:two-component system cell cycle sensor histidine kinase/response regulator CckA